MAIRWRPKTTCDCEVEYTINNSLPVDTAHGGLRVESFAFTTKCPAHTSFSDSQLWDIIWDENPRWGGSVGEILATGPNTLYDIDPNTGSRIPKPTVNITGVWSGTAPNRVYTITITGVSLTTTQKTTIRNAINTRFPGGKVVLA